MTTTLGSWGLSQLAASSTPSGRPRLIGREEESIRLLQAIDRVVQQRQPTLVTVCAAAGMGKSRLIEEALELASFSGFGERIISVRALPGDASGALLERLLLARLGLVTDVTLADDERSLQQLLWSDAEQGPICIVLEDLEHADPASLGMLEPLLSSLRGAALAICSARPAFFADHPRFGVLGGERHQHLELLPLDDSDIRALLKRTLGASLAEEGKLSRYLSETSQGNPGLLQQLTHELWSVGALEAAVKGAPPSLRPDRLPEPAAPSQQPEVSGTRLHALPLAERWALEAMALAGDACWTGLWARLSRVPGARLEQADAAAADAIFGRLLSAGHLVKVSQSRIPGEAEYVFARPDERDILLQSLSPSRARAYHRVSADWLAHQPCAHSADLLGLLARHLAAAGSSYRAALAYLDAGQLARDNGRATQAAELYYQGITELGDQDDRRLLDALHAYGVALVTLGEPASAREAFTAMLALANELGLPGKQGAALNRLGRVHRESGDLGMARDCFERAQAAFELAGDARGLASTKDDLGKLLWLQGDAQSALPLLRRGLEERQAAGDRRSLAVSLSNLALVWEEQGNTREAKEALIVAHQFFDAEGDVGGRCDTLLTLGRVATHCHDLPRAEAHFHVAVELARSALDRQRLARSLLHLGETKLRANDLAAAEPLLVEAAEIARCVEAWLDLAEAQRALAKLQLKRRRLRDARKSISSSLHLARRSQSRTQLAATLRTLAEVAAAGAWGSSTEARAVRYYMLGIELAKQTNNQRELAKGYRSFARYADRYDHRAIADQSEKLRHLSDEIFARHEAES